MVQKFNIEGLDCLCCVAERSTGIAYVLYPMDILNSWIVPAAANHKVTIVVITGMDWDNVFSPWPAPGQPPGSPDFQGKSNEFLSLLQNKLVPEVESRLGYDKVSPTRTLVGVSMSGLFTLWQWLLCDTFYNIASLSGSFWYPGFLDWMRRREIPHKAGRGYFLLGDKEAKSSVKAFDSVSVNTREIISLLRANDVDVEFESVPGDHFTDPVGRLNRAFAALYGD